MKQMHTLLFATLIATGAFAQSKNPTNKQEIDDKIKQAQQQLDKLTPEQKKMMEQMGMSTKVPSMPVGATNADVKVAMSGGAFGVPSKNAALIGAIPQITLTAATVPAYLKSLGDYVEKGITNDSKSFGQQVYSAFKANKYDAATIGNAALGYWSSGQLEIAVYMMSRACAENTSDADLLSNFAAMLSMGGAPHRAIPLLEYLSKQYPDNTTILNNLGQAWFYLGETSKADVQLEKVVRAFAYHPQANYTQCLIQQSKGNTPKAIESMKKSLAYSFSSDKINMLRKLGYKIKGSDMRKPFRPDPNPLGLRNFVRPDVPTNYKDEIKLKTDWDAFQKQIDEKSMALAKDMIPYQQAAAQQAQQVYKQVAGKTAQEIYNKAQSGSGNTAKTQSSLFDNPLSQMAEINLNEINKDGGVGYRLKTAKAAIDLLQKDYQLKKEEKKKALIKQYSITADKETELAKKGEDLGYDVCVVEQKFSEWVYSTYNKPLEEAYQNYLHQLYLKITEELYWQQFKYTDVAFEPIKISAKKEWLAALRITRYIETYSGNKSCVPERNEISNYKLADFEDFHCAYKSILDFGVYKQIFECGKSRLEFDAGRFNGNFNFKFDDKGKSRFVKATLEATVIDKTISVSKGPLQAGASVKAGVGVEFTSSGVEDIYVSGEAKITAGSDTVSDPAGIVSDPSVNVVSASGKMSLISGNMTGAISGFGK